MTMKSVAVFMKIATSAVRKVNYSMKIYQTVSLLLPGDRI